MIVPLRLGQRITGMLEFQHQQPGLYTEDDAETAGRIADQIAPVVEALHLYKREELVRRQLETIFEISQALSASLDIEETLPVLGRSLTQALALPTCAIYLYDEARRALVPRAAYGAHDDDEKRPHPAEDDGGDPAGVLPVRLPDRRAVRRPHEPASPAAGDRQPARVPASRRSSCATCRSWR